MQASDPQKAKRFFEIARLILKPLAFASKDGFAHLKSLKGVEELVANLTKEASAIAPPDEGAKVVELRALFTGFDSLPADERKGRITRALSLINSFSRPEIKKTHDIPLEEVKRRLTALKTPLEYVRGIGPKLAERLNKKGLATVEDMLYFLPLRYEDRRNIKRIRELTPGITQAATGTVLASGEVYYGRKRVYEMAISDDSGILKVKWFNYKTSYMRNRYKNGQRLMLFGTVSTFGHQKEMIHPDIEILDGEAASDELESGGVLPVYSQVENFHRKTLRKIMGNVVEGYAGFAIGGVPDEVMDRCGLLDINTAFRAAHAPTEVPTPLIRKALAFDELFLLELGLALKRRQAKKESGISFAPKGRLEARLKELLPFKLTGAQERVMAEIKADMAEPHPMNRLIQGDVGSGKTIVSFISALNAIEVGYQAAIMAPTEILAEQHYLSTHKHSDELGIKVLLLTGNMPKAARTAALEEIKRGDVDLVIGTHALIQKDVEFNKLGLAVIDEQHRFGVFQRAALRKKGYGSEKDISPDILIMTATPIPRTLSMTVFGDLDVSVIDELPPGRKPVFTKIIRESDRNKAYSAIRRELEGGSQCYIVYPLVEESEELTLKDATYMKEHLQKDVFPDFRVGLLHGRMKAEEKEQVMRDFKEKKINILVSTTVIEVGVDVPNATVMMIEHAERFGLAQLHQLRGRVGRGEKKSICLLLAAWTESEDTYKRLKVMEDTMDGFKIAEEDLKIRGPGDFLGSRQAGLPDFRTTEALSDLTILKKAREEAFKYLEANPDLTGMEGACIKEVLKSRWEGRLELAEIG